MDACEGGNTISVAAHGAAADTTARIGTRISPAALRFIGSSVGYLVRNQQASGNGNDFAFDTPTILDASPQLDKMFSPPSVPLGTNANIVFTVTNSDDLLAKGGWSFTDTLSAGLTVGGVATTNCPNTQVIAPIGGNSISVDGDLTDEMVSCSVTIAIIASATGEYANDDTNIESSFLTPPQPGTTNVLTITRLQTCK